ncbi:MAG: hypothetical protein JXC33_06620 [Deltaproteobacteria bacterium]|nr:hypothetical protein [Deltaproteobacteria bacterium]
MKNIGLRIVVIVMVILGLVVACGDDKKETAESKDKVTAEDVKREAKEALKTTLAYTQQQKDEYQKRMDAKIKEYDQKIDELKKKAEVLKEEKEAELDKKIEELQEKRTSASKKLQDLKSASGKAWEDLKDGMDASMNELEHAFKRALSHFR